MEEKDGEMEGFFGWMIGRKIGKRRRGRISKVDRTEMERRKEEIRRKDRKEHH